MLNQAEKNYDLKINLGLGQEDEWEIVNHQSNNVME